MEAIRFSETSVTSRNMQRHITEDKRLCENHKSTSFRLTVAFNIVVSILQLEKCFIKRRGINTYGGEKV
jgi:hypothetical protein